PAHAGRQDVGEDRGSDEWRQDRAERDQRPDQQGGDHGPQRGLALAGGQGHVRRTVCPVGEGGEGGAPQRGRAPAPTGYNRIGDEALAARPGASQTVILSAAAGAPSTDRVAMGATQSGSSLSYREAGVDIDAGEALVDRIRPLARRTMREGVLAGIGGFGALFEVPKRFREPVLVS